MDITELNYDKNIKYIDNNFAGSPSLGYTQGDLVKLLKIILVEGFNKKTATSVNPESLGNIVTITLPSGHGFNFNQIVNISGANQTDFNSDYRVLYTDLTSIKIRTKKVFTDITGTISVKTAPLGYSLEYDAISTTGTACFKNTSTKSPAILKIIDALPPNEYNVNWTKFARVVAGQFIDTNGEFINNQKTPLRGDFDYPEKTGNKVNGVSGIHSACRWDYAKSQYKDASSGYADDFSTINTSAYPTNWRIIGDSNTFYLFIQSMGRNYSGYAIYSFGLYNSRFSEESYNIFLVGNDGWTASNNSYPFQTGVARRNSFTLFGGDSLGLFLFKNTSGGVQNWLTFTPCGLYLAESNRQWPFKTQVNPIIGSTGDMISSPIFIKDINQDMRGELRGVQVLYGTGELQSNILLDNNSSIILQTKLFEWSSVSNNAQQVPYLFSLKDWEEV